MKHYIIKVNPQNFYSSINKTKEYFKQNTSKEVTLVLAGGIYNVNETICFDSKEFSGKCALRILASSKIRPVFTSLEKLDNDKFKKEGNKPYYTYRFTEEEKAAFDSLRTIYVNGKLAEISKTKYYRTPDAFETKEKSYTKEYGYTNSFNEHHKLYVPKAMLIEAGIENSIGAELHLKLEWEYKIYHIERLDLNDGYTDENGIECVALYTKADEYDFGLGQGISRIKRECCIRNIQSVLNKGEYAINAALGELYYYPVSDISECEICYPKVATIFDFTNFDNVTFEGIKFTGTDDGFFSQYGYHATGQSGFWGRDSIHHAAIKVTNTDNFVINDCYFEELGLNAVTMSGKINNSSIKNSRFVNLGSSALRIGNNITEMTKSLYDAQPTATRNICIENNYINHVGLTYFESCAIIITKTENTRIVHNTILNSPYTAISLGWQWSLVFKDFGTTLNVDNVEVGYNLIKSFMTELADGGAVYMVGGNAPVTHPVYVNILHDNYIIEDEKTCPSNLFFSCLYHDGACTSWQTSNNVVIHNPKLDGISARLYYQRGFNDDFIFGNASACGAASWNILAINNYFCFTKLSDMYRAASKATLHISGRLCKDSDMVDESRNLFEKNSFLLKSRKELNSHPTAVFVMKNAGCTKSVAKGKYSSIN